MPSYVTAGSANNPAALLISMPFCAIEWPSIQLGLLAAIARQHGFPCDTLHLSLDFAARIGIAPYEKFAFLGSRGEEFGNWLFSLAAFGDEAPDPEGRMPALCGKSFEPLRAVCGDAQALVELRTKAVPAFLDAAEQAADWSRYNVVGFSSSFQQNAASFALARRLKARFPHLITLFGGANFEGDMGREWVRTCPWIDYVIDGEADEAFPEFLSALAQNRSPALIPGVVSRDEEKPAPPRQPFNGLDSLPLPDYDEYFHRAEVLGLLTREQRVSVHLPFESARGCWWGEHHHCTFCGLNGATMRFRQKSTGRVMEELAELTRRYGTFHLYAVDNILSVDFLNRVMPVLRAEGRQYELFFEIKSNLTRAQVKTLAEAGVSEIQPGIESLSSHVLKLMRKGVSAAQNVNLLRWCAHYRIRVGWNLLWGFPGEREEDYRAQAALMPHLAHLDPPRGAGRIRMDRFSPHFFDRARFPVTRFAPRASLAYIYPERIQHDKIAYYFDYQFEDELSEATFAPVEAAVEDWRARWQERPSLTYRWSPGLLQIEDRRDKASPRLYSFESPLAEIYTSIIERPASAAAIGERLKLIGEATDIAEALDLFAEKGLVMRDEEVFLALALPATPLA